MSRSGNTWSWYSAPSDYSDTPTDDPRQCRVDGCRKKHAYASIDGRRIYSKYCFRHTCNKTYSAEEGYHCPTPKAEDQRYCADHLKCGEPSCRETGDYLGTADYVQWYCVRHRCEVPSCLAGAQDRQHQRCAAHMKCRVADCNRACYQRRDGRLDDVCTAHYANFKCAWAGCARRKPSYVVKYCVAHTCLVPECDAGRDVEGGVYCESHRCAVLDCFNKVADPSRRESTTCRDHTCKSPRCLSVLATSDGRFCRAHACAIAACRSEARVAGGCCAEHGCVVPACDRPRLSAVMNSGSSGAGGVYKDHCGVHDRARRERNGRPASLDVPVDFGQLRERFDRDRKRMSADLEAARRLEREREELERIEREALERERGDAYRRYSGWDRWY
ncbi:hypothetical protein VTK56DRAFT_10160 [Thermocarpiscus australiensis]